MGLTLSAYNHEVHYKPLTNHCNTDTLFRSGLTMLKKLSLPAVMETHQLEKLLINDKDIRRTTAQNPGFLF